MTRRTFATRVIESQPNKGKTIDVEVDTHVSGNIEFASGAIATLIASFDVWDSELPRLEIYGTKGTICIRDIDPLDGPNLFGGVVLLRAVDNYRWKILPRQTPYPEWTVAPNERRFNETSPSRKTAGESASSTWPTRFGTDDRNAQAVPWACTAWKLWKAFSLPLQRGVSVISRVLARVLSRWR